MKDKEGKDTPMTRVIFNSGEGHGTSNNDIPDQSFVAGGGVGKSNNEVSDQSIDSGLSDIKYKLHSKSTVIFEKSGLIYDFLKQIDEKLDCVWKAQAEIAYQCGGEMGTLFKIESSLKKIEEKIEGMFKAIEFSHDFIARLQSFLINAEKKINSAKDENT